MATGRAMAGTALVYAISDALIRGIAFVLLPLLVLHLDRAEFGTVGGLGAISAFLTQVLSFGLVGAPIRFYHTIRTEEERRAFLGTAFIWSSLAAGVVIALLHLASAGAVRALGLGDDLLPIVRVALWTSWFQILARTIPLGVFRARSDWRSYLAVSVVSFAGTVGAVYWRLAVLHQGLPGTMRGMMEGAALTALSAVFLANRDFSFAMSRGNVRASLRYGMPLIPHNIAQWTLGLSDRLLVGRILGAEALGIYHFAYQFAAGLQLLITAANGAVMPSFARVNERSTAEAISAVSEMSQRFIAVVVILGLSISMVIPPFIELFAPVGYQAAAGYVPWLIVGIVAFGYYCIPANLLTMSLGHTEGISRFTGLAALLNIGMNIVLLPVLGLSAAVLSTICSYVVMAVGVSWYAGRTTTLVSGVIRGRSLLIVFGIGAVALLLLVVAQQQSPGAALAMGAIVLGGATVATGRALKGTFARAAGA